MLGSGVAYNYFYSALGTNATGRTSAFKINGAGHLHVAVHCSDDSSADGEFTLELCQTATGTFVGQSVPELSKVAGAALADDMVLDQPGTSWAKVVYTKSAGGAADEAQLYITAF